MPNVRRLPLGNGQLVAVILGDGFKSRIFAAKLRFAFNVRSIIFDEKKTNWRYLLPIGIFQRVYSNAGGTLLSLQLEDTAELLEDSSLMLIPLTARYKQAVELSRSAVEERYVVTDPDGVIAFLT